MRGLGYHARYDISDPRSDTSVNRYYLLNNDKHLSYLVLAYKCYKVLSASQGGFKRLHRNPTEWRIDILIDSTD